METYLKNSSEIRSELKSELSSLKRKYISVKPSISNWERISGISTQSRKITAEQLNNCIMFVINDLLSQERKLSKLIED